MLRQYSAQPVRTFVVWEPVLAIDWSRPAPTALARIPDLPAAQFWDRQRLISHALGEHDRKSIVRDYIGIYPRGALWTDRPPEPLYHGPARRQGEGARRSRLG